MKTSQLRKLKIKKIASVVILLLLVTACKKTPKEEVIPEPEEISLIELYDTGNETFPLLIVDESGNTFAYSEAMDTVFVGLPNGDRAFISMDENKLPTSINLKHDASEFMIYFSDFDGTTTNLAIVNQKTEETVYIYDVNAEDLSAVSSLTNASSRNLRPGSVQLDFTGWYGINQLFIQNSGSWLEATFKIMCFEQIISGFAVVGIEANEYTLAIAAMRCGLFANSLFGAGEGSGEGSFGIGNILNSGSTPGAYANAAFSCGANCISPFIANLIGWSIGNALISQIGFNQVAINAVLLSQITGGLNGFWASRLNDPQFVNQRVWFFFGPLPGEVRPNGDEEIHAQGSLLVETSLSQSDLQVNHVANAKFDYTIPTLNKLVLNYSAYYQNVKTTNTSNNSVTEQPLGPLDWNVYTRAFGDAANGVWFSDGAEIDYELLDGKYEMKLTSPFGTITLERQPNIDIGKAYLF